MILNHHLARDPPALRRFRRIAPILVVLAMAFLVLVPGVIVHLTSQADGSTRSIERLVAHEGR